jgi:ribosome-binding factor A
MNDLVKAALKTSAPALRKWGRQGRMVRVDSLLHQAVNRVLQVNVADPRIRTHGVRVTRVQTSKDLSHMQCYYTSTQSLPQLEQSLNGPLSSFIRSKMIENGTALPKIPYLHFRRDEVSDRVDRVEHAFQKARMGTSDSVDGDPALPSEESDSSDQRS